MTSVGAQSFFQIAVYVGNFALCFSIRYPTSFNSSLIDTRQLMGSESELKGYICVQVGDHKRIAKTIEKWQRNGWRLHTYACAGIGAMMAVNH